LETRAFDLLKALRYIGEINQVIMQEGLLSATFKPGFAE
jgi:hypothetical protein